MTVYELCERDVVNVTTGQNLGKVDDISFEPETASITGVILYGRLKLFGLLGREEDTAIPWGDIEKSGRMFFWCARRYPRRPEAEKIVWSEIKWVDKVFYNNEVENVKFLKSGSLAFENREDV